MKFHSLAVLALITLPPGFSLASTLRVPGQYATIQAAVDQAVMGDTVLVAPGTYLPSSPIVFDTKKNVHLIGELGRDSTVIDGTIESRNSIGIIVEGVTVDGHVRIACNTGTAVRNCAVRHSAGSGIEISGCPGGSYSCVEISGTIIGENAGHGIEAELSGGEALITGNRIYFNGLCGVAITNSYCGISGNTICGNGGNGIRIYQATSWVAGNTIAKNHVSGISVVTEGELRTQTIGRNIVASNDHAGIYGDTQVDHSISCNDVWNNSASPDGNYTGAIEDRTGVDGNISVDPLFCNAALYNFSLAFGSPALAQSCGAMGAEDEGCLEPEPEAAQATTWGGIKAMRR